MNPDRPHSVVDSIIEEPLVVKKISAPRFLFYILHGIGITLGLWILWGLEVMRNIAFRVLDRVNVKARTRKASPYPPGQSQKRFSPQNEPTD
jgi:hypothetical protein